MGEDIFGTVNTTVTLGEFPYSGSPVTIERYALVAPTAAGADGVDTAASEVSLINYGSVEAGTGMFVSPVFGGTAGTGGVGVNLTGSNAGVTNMLSGVITGGTGASVIPEVRAGWVSI